MGATYIPERGDMVWIDFSPHKGHEQAHRRPALVLSLKLYNEKKGMMIACPITSKVKNYPFEVKLKAGKLNGAVLVDQIRSLDWHFRGVAFIQKASAEIVNEAQERIIQLITE